MLWIVSCNIGMTCVTTQTVGLNCFLQHWYDLCYNKNSWSELFLVTLVWLVLQHKQLLSTVSCNICMACVTTQTVGLNCFLQHWYDLCYNTNSWVWIVSCNTWYGLCYNINSWVWIVSCNIGMTCVTTQTVALKCFLQHWYNLCYNTNSCSEMFLTT